MTFHVMPNCDGRCCIFPTPLTEGPVITQPMPGWPGFHTCVHLDEQRRCAIYEDRPQVCRDAPIGKCPWCEP